MGGSPTGSFLRSLIGFTVFITVSFGVTFAVNTITAEQSESERMSAAVAELLEMHP